MLPSVRNLGLVAVALLLCFATTASAQSLSLISGDGQIVLENFRSTAPFVVRATDAQGQPMAGVAITWEVRDAPGGLIGEQTVTDADGYAQAFLVASTIDSGISVVPLRVAATSPLGEVIFRATTAITRVSGGAPAAPPLVEVLKPSLIAPPFTGTPGTLFPGALSVRVTVQSGPQSGDPVPNVGVRVVPVEDILAPPAATCGAPGGMAFTGADGVAVCDLVLGSETGAFRVAAYVGESWISYRIRVEVSPDGGGGGGGGGGGEPPALAITTSNTLPSARTGLAYATTLQAAGGQQPYQWSTLSPLPDGLVLNPSTGVLSGTPGAATTAQFTIQVRDNTAATVTKMFTLIVSNATAPPDELTISNLIFPNGMVGEVYFAPIFTAGGCVSPFNPASLSLSNGALPTGLAITGGAIRGTPTQSGVFEFVLTAQDACVAAAHRSFAISINTTGGTLPTPSIVAQPASLIFQVGAGAGVPPGKTVQLSANTAAGFTATASTLTGGDWLQVTPSQGTTPATLTINIGNFAGLSAGTYTGRVTVTPTNLGEAPTQISVSLEVSAGADLLVSPLSLRFEVGPGVPPPTQQTISVASLAGAVGYDLEVSTEGSSGWLFATPTTQVTPANVFVAVNALGLEPGVYRGRVLIEPAGVSVDPVEVAITLEIPQPDPTIEAVTNAASFLQGPVSPGEIVVLFGLSLGPRDLTPLTIDAEGRLTREIAGTRVLFGNAPAPLIYSSNRQVAAIVPYGVGPLDRVPVRVEYRGRLSGSVSVKVAAAAPGIFTVGATSQGAILNQDGSPNSMQNPAAPGDIVSIYATGEGQTDPPGQDGQLATGVLPTPRLPVWVKIGGAGAEVHYAGAAPTLPAGVLQVNARIPAGTPPGAVEVLLQIGQSESQPGVTVYVRPD